VGLTTLAIGAALAYLVMDRSPSPTDETPVRATIVTARDASDTPQDAATDVASAMNTGALIAVAVDAGLPKSKAPATHPVPPRPFDPKSKAHKHAKH